MSALPALSATTVQQLVSLLSLTLRNAILASTATEAAPPPNNIPVLLATSALLALTTRFPVLLAPSPTHRSCRLNQPAQTALWATTAL